MSVQERFELLVAHGLCAVPREVSFFCALEVAANCANRDRHRTRDLTLTSPGVLQPENFSNFSHAEAFHFAVVASPSVAPDRFDFTA